MIVHPLQIDKHNNIELLIAELRLAKKLVFKNLIKYLELLKKERRFEIKVTRDLENNKDRKLRKLYYFKMTSSVKVFQVIQTLSLLKKFNKN